VGLGGSCLLSLLVNLLGTIKRYLLGLLPSTPNWSIILGMQTDPQYKLRLPADLKDKIKAASEENHRSMNAEIVARLENSFTPRKHRDGEGAPDRKESLIEEDLFSADDVIAMYEELDAAMKKIARMRGSREKFRERHNKDKGEG